MGRGWGEGLVATLVLTAIAGIGVLVALACVLLFFSIFSVLLPILIAAVVIYFVIKLCSDPKPKMYGP
jgi:hypothetical protein